jgi:hypothetical protein
MSMVGFPLLLIPLAIYNILVLLMPSVSLAEPLMRLTLVSGAEWATTLADILLALGVLMLLFEIIKGARPGAKYLTDHLLSFVVSGAAAAQFLLWPKFGTSTYFLLAMMSASDFLSGVTLHVKRGGAQVAAAPSRRAARRAEPVEPPIAAEPARPAEEPQLESASAPSAASVAESVLMDHPLKSSQPAAGSGEPSSSLASPEIQPTTGSQTSPEGSQR